MWDEHLLHHARLGRPREVAQLNRRQILLSGGCQVSTAALFPPHLPVSRKDLFPSGDATGVEDTAAFQAAMAKGGVYALEAGGTYYLRRQVAITRDNSGLVCHDGQANVVMLTGAGQFDHATYTNLLGMNQTCIYALNVNKPILRGLNFTLQANVNPRVAVPLAVRGCNDIDIRDIEASGFNYAYGAMLMIDTCARGRVWNAYFHDCHPTEYLALTQITGIVVDGNRIGGVNSTYIDFQHIIASNLLIAPSLMGNGPTQFQVQQTDAMTLAGPGFNGHTIRGVTAINVGEPFDIWGDGNTITNVVIVNAYVRGISLKFGAQRNAISNVTINGTALAAVMAIYLRHNAFVPDRYPELNVFSNISAVNCGSLWATGIFGNSPEPAFYLQGSGQAAGAFDPQNNRFDNCMATGSGFSFPYVGGATGCNAGNVFNIDGTGFDRAFFWSTGAFKATVTRGNMA
jgi:hypothetical protein